MNENTEQKRLTPIKAIRQKCLDCCCGVANEVRNCPITDCPLYRFRLGRNPNINRSLTEEQRLAQAERLKRNLSGVSSEAGNSEERL